MLIENVLTITGRGTVVTGAVEQGVIRVGAAVEVVGLGPTLSSVCTGLETFGKSLDNYRPQFFFRTTDVVGVVRLEPGEMVRPGDCAEFAVELGKPVAMSVGTGFAIREGGRTVGAGTVVEPL